MNWSLKTICAAAGLSVMSAIAEATQGTGCQVNAEQSRRIELPDGRAVSTDVKSLALSGGSIMAVGSLAYVLRFASAAHLHNTIRRYTGATPRQAAMQDVHAWVRELFTAQNLRPPGGLMRLPGKAGVLPRNGRIHLTIPPLPHVTGNFPGETMQ
jgi:hypothetical protein